MSEKLLPCPFCGGEGDDSLELWANLVQCLECGARGPAQDGPEFVCDARLARTEWNRRAERTRALSQLEAGKEYEIGIYGKAFDAPGKKRAYSYDHMPDNQAAWRLGVALNDATKMSAGDPIDGGLNLLKALKEKGFGVFELSALASPSPAPEAEPVGDKEIDAFAALFQNGFTNGNAVWTETPEHHKTAFREGVRWMLAGLPRSTPTPAVDADAVIEACAKVADYHHYLVAPHHPDKPGDDPIAQGYGNAALNIATAIRALSLPPSADKGE